MENKQSRWRSKVLWVAIAAQVVALLAFFGVLKLIGITEDWLNGTIGGVLQILVLLGVLNNPTDAEHY
jgi:uncharacterized membrane protein